MQHLIQKAMHQSDDWVVEFDYADAKGLTTHRVVSPIRFLGGDRFLALCLSRAAPRQFNVKRCRNMKLRPAAAYVMPVELTPADITC